MNISNSGLPRWMLLLPIIFVMLACSFLQGTKTSPSPVPESSTEPAPITEIAQGQAPTDESVSEEPDPLDHLLNLHSIRFNLTAWYPDETSCSTEAEIDARGNLRLKFITPNTPLITREDVQPSAEASTFEYYVIDGKGYQFDLDTSSWIADPEPVDYHATLSERLHGPAGPALWLSVLPNGSLQFAGEESIGGFTTKKYAVNGTVAAQTITGTLWFDTESHALVQVELHVPAALLSIPEEPASGELKITLETQKADIPAITIPK